MKDTKGFIEEIIPQMDSPEKLYKLLHGLGYKTLDPSFDHISEDRLNLLNLGDVILLGFAPWNETCFAKQLAFGSFAIPLAQNLSHRSHTIPLGFTPCNQKHISLGRFQL